MFTSSTPLMVYHPTKTTPATVSKLQNNETGNTATSENQQENNQKYFLLVKLDGQTNSGYRVNGSWSTTVKCRTLIVSNRLFDFRSCRRRGPKGHGRSIWILYTRFSPNRGETFQIRPRVASKKKETSVSPYVCAVARIITVQCIDKRPFSRPRTRRLLNSVLVDPMRFIFTTHTCRKMTEVPRFALAVSVVNKDGNAQKKKKNLPLKHRIHKWWGENSRRKYPTLVFRSRLLTNFSKNRYKY